MNARTLDTRRIVKRLVEVGFSDQQAETVTDVVREVREFDLSELATKSDLEAVRRDLSADIETLRRDLSAEIETLRRDLSADIETLRGGVNTEFVSVRGEFALVRKEAASVRSELLAEIANVKTGLLMWLIPLILAQFGGFVALFKLFPGH